MKYFILILFPLSLWANDEIEPPEGVKFDGQLVWLVGNFSGFVAAQTALQLTEFKLAETQQPYPVIEASHENGAHLGLVGGALISFALVKALTKKMSLEKPIYRWRTPLYFATSLAVTSVCVWGLANLANHLTQ